MGSAALLQAADRAPGSRRSTRKANIEWASDKPTYHYLCSVRECIGDLLTVENIQRSGVGYEAQIHA